MSMDARVQSDFKETIHHGTEEFPLAVYSINIPLELECVQYAHWHDEIEFFLIENGSAQFQADVNQRILATGDMVLLRSGTIHSALRCNHLPCKFIALVFSLPIICSQNNYSFEKIILELSSKGSSPVFFYDHKEQSSAIINALFKEIRDAYMLKKAGYELFIKSRLIEIFYWISSHLSEDKKAEAAEAMTVAEIKRSLIYIHNNFYRDLSLKELSEHINLSSGQFDRTFKKIVGISPFSYLIGYRIQKGAELLKSTNKSITEIAIEVGFSNFSYFSKCFRNRMGITPSGYRKD